MNSVGSSVALFVALCFCGAPSAVFAGTVETSAAEIVLPKNPSKDESKAAQILKRILAEASPKSEVRISERGREGGGFKIYFEKDESSARPTPENPEGRQEFSVSCGSDGAVVSYPFTQEALGAVGEFLRRFADIEIFIPASIGGNIPQADKLRFKTGDFSFEPSYSGRFFGLYCVEAKELAALNGENRSFLLHNHNLTNIVDVKVARKHPEWLAIYDGKRRGYDYASQMQIDFLNPEVREFVAKKADEFFAESKDNAVFAATYADSAFFDQTPPTLRLRKGFTPHGCANYSDLVFSFTNAVAKSVKKDFSDRFVGELAYHYTEAPPSFRLENNILVYLCIDSGQHFSAKYKAADFALLDEWTKSGISLLGIYDYNYGKPFFIPRNTSEEIGESIKKAYASGARMYTCETCALWAYDAHKIWIMSRLLKDVSLDVGALEREFFDGYYGAASAHVQGFFETAKLAWRARSQEPVWLKLYKRESQAEVLSDSDISDMEKSLSLAEKSPVQPKVRLRINEIRLAFDVTKAFVRSYRLQKKLFYFPYIDKENAATALDTLEAAHIAKTARSLAIKRYEENTRYPKVNFDEWTTMSFINAEEIIGESLLCLEIPPISNKVMSILGNDFINIVSRLKKSKNILYNSNFENNLDGWDIYTLSANPEKLSTSKKVAYSGAISVEMYSKNFIGITQRVRVKEKKIYAAQAQIYGYMRTGDVCYLRIRFKDMHGNVLLQKSQQLPTISDERFTKLRILSEAPEKSVSAAVSIFAGNMSEETSLFIDDVSLFEGEK